MRFKEGDKVLVEATVRFYTAIEDVPLVSLLMERGGHFGQISANVSPSSLRPYVVRPPEAAYKVWTTPKNDFACEYEVWSDGHMTRVGDADVVETATQLMVLATYVPYVTKKEK